MKAYLVIGILATVLVHSIGQEISCWGQPSGLVFNNALVDANYYVCLNNIPVPMECQSGYVFCKGGSACVTNCTTATTRTTATTTTKATTVSTPTIKVELPTPPAPSPVACTGYPNGTMRTDPKNCRGYYMCVGGKAVAGTCVNNYSFDGVRGTCVNAACSA